MVYYFFKKCLTCYFQFVNHLLTDIEQKDIRGSESQLKIQISRHIVADEKISNLPITNSKNNISENQDCIALRYIIIYHFTKFEVFI